MEPPSIRIVSASQRKQLLSDFSSRDDHMGLSEDLKLEDRTILLAQLFEFYPGVSFWNLKQVPNNWPSFLQVSAVQWAGFSQKITYL